MKKFFIAFIGISLLAFSCKNKEKVTKTTHVEEGEIEVVTEEVTQEDEQPKITAEDLARFKPKVADSLYFLKQTTPCFGQCPVYTFKVFQSGIAVLEGKKFFDYEGVFETRLNEDQLNQILHWAEEVAYFELEHVYDAPITDIPSSTTGLYLDDRSNWVYNRANSPEELRIFERNIEMMIKDLQWKPSKRAAKDGAE